jgi:hypothetical protein
VIKAGRPLTGAWKKVQTSAVQSIKLAIVELTGLSKDTLHVYGGLSVFLAVAAVSRKRLRSGVPLLTVVAVAIAGEVVDMRDELSSRVIGSGKRVFTTCSIRFSGRRRFGFSPIAELYLLKIRRWSKGRLPCPVDNFSARHFSPQA